MSKVLKDLGKCELVKYEAAICSSTVTAISVAAESVSYSKAKAQAKYVPNPYASPGQKKQGRENKNKNRKKPNYEPRNNRRDAKPARLKHHTPMKDHQKFEQ